MCDISDALNCAAAAWASCCGSSLGKCALVGDELGLVFGKVDVRDEGCGYGCALGAELSVYMVRRGIS